MERRQALVQPRIMRGLRQNLQQGHNRLFRQIIREKQVGIRDCGSHRDGYVIGKRLLDGWRGGFELLDNHRAFFRRNARNRVRRIHQIHDLLIILQVDLILRLGGGQHLVQVASALKIPTLYAGMRQ